MATTTKLLHLSPTYIYSCTSHCQQAMTPSKPTTHRDKQEMTSLSFRAIWWGLSVTVKPMQEWENGRYELTTVDMMLAEQSELLHYTSM